jgi:hypothetical protein
MAGGTLRFESNHDAKENFRRAPGFDMHTLQLKATDLLRDNNEAGPTQRIGAL